MDAGAEFLVPSSERAIFLLTVPPKSLRNHDHSCIQVQRVVSEIESDKDLRIKPIFNLEHHRLFTTKIIELIHGDAKIAEFHPMKAQREDRTNGQSVTSKIVRPRAFSLDNSVGGYGGRITVSRSFPGLHTDINVSGSEEEGLFRFRNGGTMDTIWRKSKVGTTVDWTIERTGKINKTDNSHHTVPTNTSIGQDRRSSPEPSHEATLAIDSFPMIRRTKTDHTMTSQYTTAFENESQLSCMTSSPQMSEQDLGQAVTMPSVSILSSYPMPHLSLEFSELESLVATTGSVSTQDEQMYQLLLCALWLAWCSPDLLHEPDQHRTIDHDTDESDLNSPSLKQSLRTAMSPGDESRRLSIMTNKSEGAANRRKKSKFIQRIARICG